MGRIENALKAQELVDALLDEDTPPIAFQKSLAALGERERIAVNLWRTGDVKTKGEALQAAGYGVSTCKNAARVFDRPKVQAALMLYEKSSEPVKTIDADSFLTDLVELAHADPMDALDDLGRVRKVSEWPKPLRRMVKSLEFNVLGGVEKVTFEGRASIQAMVGKHRNVKAFDQRTVERRVYVVRDYTGRTGPDGKPIEESQQPGQGPQLIDAEATIVDGSADDVEAVGRDDSGGSSPGVGGAQDGVRASLETADFDDISDIDRGFIPVPSRS